MAQAQKAVEQMAEQALPAERGAKRLSMADGSSENGGFRQAGRCDQESGGEDEL
ncbi:MAG TPA: hypothetical protein VIE43_07845 [Thermoanaerobaculia bacterium]|nr:hypothetical protein [Thermoanaerobaculia bacterium]